MGFNFRVAIEEDGVTHPTTTSIDLMGVASRQNWDRIINTAFIREPYLMCGWRIQKFQNG